MRREIRGACCSVDDVVDVGGGDVEGGKRAKGNKRCGDGVLDANLQFCRKWSFPRVRCKVTLQGFGY